MPDKNGNNTSGEDLTNVIEFYNKVWGLKPDDAVDQAVEDYKRGPNSNVFKNRAKQAQEWKDRLAESQPKEVDWSDPGLNKPVVSSATPSSYDMYQAGAPGRVAASVAQANQEQRNLADPAARDAQDSLAWRRAQLAAIPPSTSTPTETIDPEAIQAQAALSQRRNQLGFVPKDPEGMAAQYQLDLRRQQLSNAAPISPGPVTAAFQTPVHLEDANLSSWQSLADLLGYQNLGRGGK